MTPRIESYYQMEELQSIFEPSKMKLFVAKNCCTDLFHKSGSNQPNKALTLLHTTYTEYVCI